MAVEPVPHRFTVDEYHRMAEAGLFGEDDRVELLEGEVVETAPIGSRHAACVRRLNRAFGQRLGSRVIVAVQDPVRLGERSEPQPDVALLRLRADDYAARHPAPEDLMLVVEVADTSRVWDREHKVPLYAAAGVSGIWLVDVLAEEIEVFRRPDDGAYRDVRVVRHGDNSRPRPSTTSCSTWPTCCPRLRRGSSTRGPNYVDTTSSPAGVPAAPMDTARASSKLDRSSDESGAARSITASAAT